MSEEDISLSFRTYTARKQFLTAVKVSAFHSMDYFWLI